MVISAAIEAQIAELESAEDREVFLQEYGLTESGLNKLLRASYHLLGPHYVFHGRRKRSPGLDDQKGLESTSGSRRYPH